MSPNQYPTAEWTFPPIRTANGWEWELEFAVSDGEAGAETPLDLTGAEARFQVRRRATDSVTVVSLTDTDGIQLDGARCVVTLRSEATAALSLGDYVADLQLRLPGGDWWTPIEGRVAVVVGVSR